MIALQRSEQKRIEYMAEMSLFNPDMFIWIDETGSDRRKSVRKYGYALRGIFAIVVFVAMFCNRVNYTN